MDYPDLQKACRDGAKFRTSEGEYRVKCEQIGRLVVTSGRIVACDPLCYLHTRPFRRRVPVGRYPVLLSIAPGYGILCAILRLSRRTPRRWLMASQTGRPLRVLKPGYAWGYLVDSGTGCFMDMKAAEILRKRMDEDPNYRDRLIEAMDGAEGADFQLDAKTGLNVVLFQSGDGDGEYVTYWGYDAAGELACLVTDFGLPGEGDSDDDADDEE